MAPQDPSANACGSRPRGTGIGLVLWPSFLSACVASGLFFAAVDPELLRDAGPRVFADLDRETGYALGFFFFWCSSAIASALSVWLIFSKGYIRPIRPSQ